MITSFKSLGQSGGGGTTNYSALENKPQINGVTLDGNKTTEQLGIVVNGKRLEPVEELPISAETGTVVALYKSEKRFVDYIGSFYDATENTVTFKAYSDTAHTSTLDICQARIPSQISPDTTNADLKAGDGGWSALTPSDYVDWTAIEMQGLEGKAYFKVDFFLATVYIRIEEGYFDTIEGLSAYTQEAYTETSTIGTYQYNGTEWDEVGGYVLPTATPTTLGGVKIGNGINVDSDGTISVSGGSGGGGIEVVTELPSSGSDGQVVILKASAPMTVIHSEIGNTTTVTAYGMTRRICVMLYNVNQKKYYYFVNTDNSVDIVDGSGNTVSSIDVDSTETVTMGDVNATITTTTSGLTVATTNTKPSKIIEDVDKPNYDIAYIWKDDPTLTANIKHIGKVMDYSGNWDASLNFAYHIAEFDYGSNTLPSNDTIILKGRGTAFWPYLYTVVKNGILLVYEGDDNGITASTPSYSYCEIDDDGDCQYFRYQWKDGVIKIGYVKDNTEYNGFSWPTYDTNWKKSGWVVFESEKTITNGGKLEKGLIMMDGQNRLYEITTEKMNYKNCRINGSASYTNEVYFWTWHNNGLPNTMYIPTNSGTTGSMLVSQGNAEPLWVNNPNYGQRILVVKDAIVSTANNIGGSSIIFSNNIESGDTIYLYDTNVYGNDTTLYDLDNKLAVTAKTDGSYTVKLFDTNQNINGSAGTVYDITSPTYGDTIRITRLNAGLKIEFTSTPSTTYVCYNYAGNTGVECDTVPFNGKIFTYSNGQWTFSQ